MSQGFFPVHFPLSLSDRIKNKYRIFKKLLYLQLKGIFFNESSILSKNITKSLYLFVLSDLSKHDEKYIKIMIKEWVVPK